MVRSGKKLYPASKARIIVDRHVFFCLCFVFLDIKYNLKHFVIEHMAYPSATPTPLTLKIPISQKESGDSFQKEPPTSHQQLPAALSVTTNSTALPDFSQNPLFIPSSVIPLMLSVLLSHFSTVFFPNTKSSTPIAMSTNTMGRYPPLIQHCYKGTLLYFEPYNS